MILRLAALLFAAYSRSRYFMHLRLSASISSAAESASRIHVTSKEAAVGTPSARRLSLSLTSLLITVVILAVCYFAGWLRPTGLLSRMKPLIPLNRQLRGALLAMMVALPLAIFWTAGYLGIWHRLQLEFDGKVISRQDLAQTRQTHGPTSVYRLQGSDGSIREYTATTSDADLPRTIPVGADIVKRRWDLHYLSNGQRIDDFPVTAYVVFLAGAIASLTGAAVLVSRGF